MTLKSLETIGTFDILETVTILLGGSVILGGKVKPLDVLIAHCVETGGLSNIYVSN